MKKEALDFTKYTQFVQIMEKTAMLMEMETEPGEIVKITNKGKFPIEQAHANILFSAKKDKKIIKRGNVTFKRDITLQPEDCFQIPLHVKLEKPLVKSKLITIYEEEIPSGEKDAFGELIFRRISVKHILHEFDLNIQATLDYKVFKEDMSIKKEFVLQYRFYPEFLEPFGEDKFRSSKNYTIYSYEKSGTWLD